MKQLGLEVSFQLRSLLMLNTFEVAMFLHISSFCENTLMFPIFVSLTRFKHLLWNSSGLFGARV